ncbi:hypothetical protein TrVE_jg6977 [Triparma verrucosa]|uniref:Uncharacterized protein n=1 Tax=Triparma verrucosa TaxID=1606542 RepID=A0A9W7BLS2_9STRA|nr:hypothetical protein TrVE_jg6977 [Triparma verrucosa]
MPSQVATPEKAMLDLLEAEPLPNAANTALTAYIAEYAAVNSGEGEGNGQEDFQALLLSLSNRLLNTATEADIFSTLLSTLLNNLRLMTPRTIIVMTKAITSTLTAPPKAAHIVNVTNLSKQMLPILASFLEPAEVTSLYDDLVNFDKGFGTTACTLLRDVDSGSIVRLSEEQLTTSLNNLTSSLSSIPSDSVSALIYQVLLLFSSADAGSNLTHRALDGISSWFDENITVSTQPNPEQTYLLTTSLSSFVSALRHSRSLGKIILKLLSCSSSGPTPSSLRFERLTPFKIALACTLASVNSNYKESAIAAMRDLILEEVDFREKAEVDHWVAASIKHSPRPNNHLLQTLKAISDTIDVTASSSAVETVVSTLIGLAFSLVDSVKKDVGGKKQKCASSAAEAGRAILVRVFCGVGEDEATTESIRRSIIKSLSQRCTGHAPNALEHSKLLSVLPKEYLYEFTGELVEWLGHLATGGLPPKAASSHLLPCLTSLLQRERQHLDVALVFAKKSLFSADVSKRCAGAGCLVALLGVMSSGSAEEEVVGYLKRCLTQQREVRWAVYAAVCRTLNDDGDEAHSKKVASAMERLIHSQLDRVLEIQEVEEVRQARRARAASSNNGEPALSQMTQGNDDDDKAVLCPFNLPRIIGSGGEEGLLGDSEKASGSPTLASAKRKLDEPLSFLLIAASCIVEKLGQSCPLAQDLTMIREKASACEVDHYLQWTRDDEENCPSVPGDNSREVATCFVVAGVAEALTIGLDTSTESGEKQTLAFLQLRSDAIKEAMYLTVPSDDALRKAKKAPQSETGTKKKKSSEPKTTDSNMLQDRAEKAISEYLRGDFCQLLDDASENVLALISDSVYTSLMTFGGLAQGPDGKKLVSTAQLHQRVIMAGDLMATDNLTGRTIPTIALKLSPILFSQFTANIQRKSARTGPKKNVGGSLCSSALTGFLSGLRKMASNIDGLSMTPTARVTALLARSFELGGLEVSSADVDGADEKLQGFLDVLTAPVGDAPQDSQTSRKGGVFVELVSVDAQEEASLICDAVSSAAKLLTNPNARVRQGARMLGAWQQLNIAFEGQLGLSRVNDGGKTAVASNSSLKAVTRAVSATVKLSGGLNGDTRIYSGKEDSDDMGPLRQERSEMGFSTGFGGEYWPAFSAFSAVSFPVGACGRIVISTVEGIGEKGGNFDELKSFDDFDQDYELKGLSTLFTDAPKMTEEVMSCLISACDRALVSAEYLFRLVGCSRVGNGKVSAVDLIGMRMLAVAEILSAMAPWAEFIDTTCSFACSVLKTSKRLYALNTRIMTGITTAKIEVGRMYRLFIAEMSERCTPVIAALMLGVQELQATGGASAGKNGKTRYITSGAIQAHGRTAANLSFERERSDNAMAKYSKRLQGMGKSTLANWVAKQILTTKARDFKIVQDDIRQAKEREMAALGGGEKKKKVKKRKGEGVKKEKKVKKRKKKNAGEDGDAGDGDGLLPDVPSDSDSGEDEEDEEGGGGDEEM